jgi:hypothetical protein
VLLATRMSTTCAAALVVLTACSSDGSQPAAVPQTPITGSPTTSVAPAAETPKLEVPEAGAVPPSATPSDVTRGAAAEFVPPPVVDGQSSDPASVVAPGVDYADPLAVAVGYVTKRLTYRYDDPVYYVNALTAPAFTTPAFAARSRPSEAALTRLAAAQEASSVVVDVTELESEAPNSETTRYVAVASTTTTSYRGGGGTQPAVWTLRLVQAPAGQWRVDGVLSTE